MQSVTETRVEAAPDVLDYGEIVRTLTDLVDTLDQRLDQGEDRFVRALYNSLQASLDSALRLEWFARSIDDENQTLLLD